jgi:sulfur relay (sulfurtransferase) complex TusBCD TusD component (DsrE family)
MQLASVAKEEGHDVHVFFLDDGVTFARKGGSENSVAVTGDDIESHKEKLRQAHVPFYV